VSVIGGWTNTVMATITVGSGPFAVAVNPVTGAVYVGNAGSGTVSVIRGEPEQSLYAEPATHIAGA
jgi:DNA-binding beta-propeller fold protein YncE